LSIISTLFPLILSLTVVIAASICFFAGHFAGRDSSANPPVCCDAFN
jgi:hypothetical protein